jgi:hypothetical protein
MFRRKRRVLTADVRADDLDPGDTVVHDGTLCVIVTVAPQSGGIRSLGLSTGDVIRVRDSTPMHLAACAGDRVQMIR